MYVVSYIFVKLLSNFAKMSASLVYFVLCNACTVTIGNNFTSSNSVNETSMNLPPTSNHEGLQGR